MQRNATPYRGAPMGRTEHTAAPSGPVRLFRVRLDSGGYDAGGAYWGLALAGGPGFLYCSTDPVPVFFPSCFYLTKGHTMTTYTLDRNMRGELRARTVTPLGFDSRELHTETSKSSRGGLSCCAAVYRRTADGRGLEHCFGIARDGSDDYRATLAQDRNARATEKAIRTMHAAALAQHHAATLAAACAHYGKPAPTVESTEGAAS